MLGEKIATLRKEKGISQEELADVLFTSRQAVSKWERGESDPDIERLKDLASYFNVSIDYLLGYDIESSSAKGFVDRIIKCLETRNLDISEEEIKLAVARNINNFTLLIRSISYLFELWMVNKEDHLIDLVIDYCRRAIVIYQADNVDEITLNDIHRMIVIAYVIQNRYDLAKEYYEDNKVVDSDALLSDCEIELGNYQKAEEIASNSYIKGLSSILNSNINQVKILVLTNRFDEAYELAKWTVSFIGSIGKSDDLFFAIVYALTAYMSVIEKYMGLDYSSSLKFLKENYSRISTSNDNSEKVKFYYNKKVNFITYSDDIKTVLYKEIERFKKDNNPLYEDALSVYNEIFK